MISQTNAFIWLSASLVILSGCNQAREQAEPVNYDVPKMFKTETWPVAYGTIPFEELKKAPDFSHMDIIAVGGRRSEPVPEEESSEN